MMLLFQFPIISLPLFIKVEMSSEPMVDQILARYALTYKNRKSVLCENEIYMKYEQRSKQATKQFQSGDQRKPHIMEFG